MSAIYDNWERLVAVVLRKQQLWELFHEHSRSPSIQSEASDFSSSFNFSSPLHDLAFDFSSLGSSSRSCKAPTKLVLISEFSPIDDVDDIFLTLKSINISEPAFKNQMEIVRNVRHENVAALRGYYSSEEARFMLYDYYSDGSIHALLHGQTGQNQSPVAWETRLRTAIGAARGVAAIHTQNGGELVHGNIKASNIFLNSQHYGIVSDLGLGNMIEPTCMPTALCYAPEVKNAGDVSQASDVYSFGILLLELLTRKSPANVPHGPEAVDLVKLVFDAEVMHPTIREQVVKMLQLGFRCVARSIKRRPKMSEVVSMLEDIKKMNREDINKMNPGSIMNQHVSLKRKLVFFEYANPTFEIEDLLNASAELLREGTFGTSYKARFENGNTVMVKVLRDVIVTSVDFQQHMKVIGKTRHENIAELMAYCYSVDAKFLVYDYYNKQSLSDLLHGEFRSNEHRHFSLWPPCRGTNGGWAGKTGTGMTSLNWETRLKISVGAARGVAHIHRQDGDKLVHGNIKSSNIFIDGQRYGIFSDAGLAKLVYPISRSVMKNPSYCAPEVKDTRQVSQASDVFSFGIVLLELVSGRQSQQRTDDGELISLDKWIRTVLRDGWTPEVIDVELLRYQDVEDTMVQLLQIGVDCAAFWPERRPRMPQVVKMLEEISGIEPSHESTLEDGWEQPTITSRLEDLLEDLLPTLTP
ncbi:UNVERIFIED_CONTAM: putative inactive receptor kinase [Sesamum radiatum]|uniref:Inactive receptor kinase n=1 Tax=Sesamum radiatum TaxID=300843 RepID=A0AAW2KE74_SESRA